MQWLFSTQRSVIPNHQISTANGNILPAINSVFSDYILRLVRNICGSVSQLITGNNKLVFLYHLCIISQYIINTEEY